LINRKNGRQSSRIIPPTWVKTVSIRNKIINEIIVTGFKNCLLRVEVN
jgi:hypothetical protein